MSDLKHPLLGYAPSTTLQVLNHLYNTWSNITSTMLEEGMEKMKISLDSTCLISHIWEQIQQGQVLANAVSQHFTEPQLINMAYHAIFVSSILMDTCRDWKHTPVMMKTWVNLKIHFNHAHREILEL
eukprot:15347626-Ditylum_brightwellii.AAC.2